MSPFTLALLCVWHAFLNESSFLKQLPLEPSIKIRLCASVPPRRWTTWKIMRKNVHKNVRPAQEAQKIKNVDARA